MPLRLKAILLKNFQYNSPRFWREEHKKEE